MFSIDRLSKIAFLFFSLFIASIANAGTVPLEEFGKLPDVEHAAISPSGQRIAFVTTVNGKHGLLAIDSETGPIQFIAVSHLKVRGIDWIGEDRIMLTTSQTEDLYGFTVDKFEFGVGRIIPLSKVEEGGVIFGDSNRYVDAIVGNYGIRQIKGRYYGFFGGIELTRDKIGTRSGYVFDHGRPHLFRVDLQNFRVAQIARAAPVGHDSDWLIDSKGEVAYTLEVSEKSGNWVIRNARGKSIISGNQPSGGVRLVGLSHDGAAAIVAERGPENTQYWKIGQEGGERQPFLDNKGFDRLFWDQQTGHLMGYAIGEGENERLIFFNAELNKKAEQVRAAFSTYQSSITQWTSDLETVIVRTSGNKDSGTFYSVSLAQKRADPVAYVRQKIGPDAVGAISTIDYEAQDGTKLDGILTLPPGKKAENLPLIMLPHGGPHSADSAEFDWWAQAFASRGYAVFQPNFRGSTNRDTAFKRAGYGEWGRAMQTDKSDAIAVLAKTGMIDPERTCIVGASYGGYAALAGVTLQEGFYRCAVAVAPVSDIADMYREDYRASGRARTTRTALREQLGDPDLWDAVSPLKHAKQANAPIMLIHGRDDTVVPYSHSTKMADKLQDASKPFELVTLDGEDHWLSLSDTRQQMLKNAVRFVETHNPPG